MKRAIAIGEISKVSTNKPISEVTSIFFLIKSKFDLSENNFSIPLKEARENFEKTYLSSQLKKFKGNIAKTANFIGMERSALHRKLKSLGIKGIN